MNEVLNRIEIPVSKSKTILLLLGSIGFVLIGILFVIDPSKFISIKATNSTYIFLLGFVSIIFFGFGVYVFIKRLGQSIPGLIINEKGIIYDPKDEINGFVEWSIITKFSKINIHNQKLIMIHVDNPDEFIKNQSKALKRKLMNFNQSSYGAPIGLAALGLSISFDSLYQLILDNYNQHNKNARPHNIV